MAEIILIKSLFGKSDDFPVEATFSQKTCPNEGIFQKSSTLLEFYHQNLVLEKDLTHFHRPLTN